ncbi:hybrid sensor histidine kinase/response regulator [Polaromonas sp. DSR2-3-2]|uniref:hybrid sensor histidine kinase/response regulator n=1 Tax=Polaromonas sp. DSR2-3-2 TaxID=2804622 RepID=UPI003CF7D90B
MKNHGIPDELVRKLREANENLVVTSLRAQDLQDQAEAAVQRQTEFLSMLAHELRNPLAPISMAADLLGKISSAHPQLPRIQQIISRQVSHMKHLLDDLLDASRVSSGKITLKKNYLLLADVVRSAAEISQPVLNSHNQELMIDLPQQPVVIDGDATRLSQVFSNLLINASKYSPPGKSISVSARHSADGKVAVSIKDQGVGIEPDVQSYIFDLFTQAPRTLDRSEGGLGIGLSMVRTLVELHGGSVQVHSDGLGHGSEFVVVLPLVAKPDLLEADRAVPALPARSCRILIIEDNVDANETLNFCLSFEGHKVVSAFDGPTGLAMAKKGNFDVVMCDIGLPGMDGYEVLRQLKPSDVQPVPYCIAMTGYDSLDHRDHAKNAGFDSYLVKPVSIETLQDIVSKNFLVASSG